MKEQPECKVDEWGIKTWHLRGKWHREDGPAIEYPDGTKHWYLHGKTHREDGPAYEQPDGYKEWYLHGEQARPEQIVDLHLIRGTFCYYNEQTDTLHFDESNEKRTRM